MRETSQLSQILTRIFQVSEEELMRLENIKDLNSWDSLKHMQLVAGIESEFEVSLSVDEIISFTCVKDIQEILDSKGCL